MIVRPDQLRAIFPKASSEILAEFTDEALTSAGIVTLTRLRFFLAQLGHESAGLTVFEENLFYSPQGLTRTWPKRFTKAQAVMYAYQPKRIASRVYANRLGNGPEASGDGWTYRGRGLIQTTGKDNYRRVEQSTRIPCLDSPDLLAKPNGAMASALVFWISNNLNCHCDACSFPQLTKAINGGYNGLRDRCEWLDRVSEVV